MIETKSDLSWQIYNIAIGMVDSDDWLLVSG